MGVRLLTPQYGNELTVTVSSLTLGRNTLVYMNAGVPTATGNGTAVDALVTQAVTSADTTARLYFLKPGDKLEMDYTGSAASLKIGDFVDMSDGDTANAADETVGSTQLRVLSVNTTDTLVTVEFLGRSSD